MSWNSTTSDHLTNGEVLFPVPRPTVSQIVKSVVDEHKSIGVHGEEGPHRDRDVGPATVDADRYRPGARRPHGGLLAPASRR